VKCPCGAKLPTRVWGVDYRKVCYACDVRMTGERARRCPAYQGKSGRAFTFKPAPALTPEQGKQLELMLRGTTAPKPRKARTRDRGVVLAELEAAGERAMDRETIKRPVECELVYESMGGEILRTTLRGLSFAEREYVLRKTLRPNWSKHHACTAGEIPGEVYRTARVVVWPSQSAEQPVRIEHDDERAA